MIDRLPVPYHTSQGLADPAGKRSAGPGRGAPIGPCRGHKARRGWSTSSCRGAPGLRGSARVFLATHPACWPCPATWRQCRPSEMTTRLASSAWRRPGWRRRRVPAAVGRGIARAPRPTFQPSIRNATCKPQHDRLSRPSRTTGRNFGIQPSRSSGHGPILPVRTPAIQRPSSLTGPWLVEEPRAVTPRQGDRPASSSCHSAQRVAPAARPGR